MRRCSSRNNAYSNYAHTLSSAIFIAEDRRQSVLCPQQEGMCCRGSLGDVGSNWKGTCNSRGKGAAIVRMPTVKKSLHDLPSAIFIAEDVRDVNPVAPAIPTVKTALPKS